MNVTLFDTSVATDNLGDEIIIDAVEAVIAEVLPNAYVFRVATHEYMSWVSRGFLKKSTLSVIGGTNLLSAHMGPFALWKVMPWDIFAFDHAVLLGVQAYLLSGGARALDRRRRRQHRLRIKHDPGRL